MSAPSTSPRPRDGWSHRYGFLIPIALVALAGLSLWPRADDPAACAPLDPVRVSLGGASYAIPAVLLPNLRTGDHEPPDARSEALSGMKAHSRSGARLRWWWCKNQQPELLAVDKFSIEGRWIADAVNQGELGYRFLPHVSHIVVRRGTYRDRGDSEFMTTQSGSGLFRIHCGTTSDWTLPHTGPRTGTLCTAHGALATNTVISMVFHIDAREGRPTINGRKDWPEIAREAEHLIRSMQAAPE